MNLVNLVISEIVVIIVKFVSIHVRHAPVLQFVLLNVDIYMETQIVDIFLLTDIIQDIDIDITTDIILHISKIVLVNQDITITLP